MSAPSSAVRDLIRTLDSAFRGPAWHGPALRSSLDGLSAEEARWRPAADRNSIWQLALHAAYGKHLMASRLDPAARARFARPLEKAWWPRVDDPGTGSAADDAWRLDRELLDASHDRLIATLDALPLRRLAESRRGSRFTLGDEALGCALHDVYHAGQVVLLRRLMAVTTAGSTAEL